MHPEIENLIEMALADGEVTEKERAIILRKAEALGEDKDETEMILDGKIALMMKEQNASQQQSKPKSNKEGDMKKCPSCGAPVQSFATKCGDCGHEFSGIKSASSIERLYDELQKIEEIERSRQRSWAQKIDGDMGVQKGVATRQASAISAFPVPNTKEDLLEFISIAGSEAKKKLSMFIMHAHPDAVLKKAWKSKCEQVITKARFSMKDDKRTLEEIEIYAKQLKIK
jgi:ribosomal protein L34E